jgi:non-ribosomal peptide synthase protein (TIGR01720 family)
VFTEHSNLAPAPESSGQPRAHAGTRRYPLAFGGGVFGGRMTLSWTYASELFDEAALCGLAEDYMNVLRQLIRERHLGSRSYAPSDFPRAKLDKQGLARALSRVGATRTRRGT